VDHERLDDDAYANFSRPRLLDGALVRLVTDETTVWAERWTGRKWVADTSIVVAEVMKGPSAGPETLSRFGYRLSE